MSYEKNTWANGDVITAAKLNNMESGIENADTKNVAPLICLYNESTGLLDTTFGEIKTAIDSGQSVLYKGNVSGDSYDINMVTSYSVHESEGYWYAECIGSFGTMMTDSYQSYDEMAASYMTFSD